MKFETLAIHAGQEPDPNNGAVMTPVYCRTPSAADTATVRKTNPRILFLIVLPDSFPVAMSRTRVPCLG